jgi:uncharacterized coiled-coil protein SlyX
MDTATLVAIVIACIGAGTAIYSAWVNRGEARRARQEPTWVNLNDRVTALESDARRHRAQMSAVSRILHAIADQWPNERGPDLPPEDMKLIEEALPPLWIRPAQRHRWRQPATEESAQPE